jgi:hypothetical protein
MNTLPDEQLVELEGGHTLEALVHETFPSPLGDTGDFEGHSVIRTENGGVWYADYINPDDGVEQDHAEIVRRVNAFPALLSTIQSLRTKLDEAKDTIERISESLPEPFTCHKHPEITGMHIIDDVRDLVKELQKTQVNEQDYSKQVRTLTAERDSLQAWKDSMMQVELEWNEQKVGKLLKLPLGSSIKAGIEPAIVELIDEVDSLRTRLADAQARAERAEGERDRLRKLLDCGLERELLSEVTRLTERIKEQVLVGARNKAESLLGQLEQHHLDLTSSVKERQEAFAPSSQRSDGERLEWLESQDFSLERQWNIKDCHPGGVRLDVTFTDEHWKFDTVRECIDAAMNATAPEVKGGGE